MGTRLIFVKVSALLAIFSIVILIGAFSQGAVRSNSIPDGTTSSGAVHELNGPQLFRAYCASCHGADAKGRGPAVSALRTRPPDLTRLKQMNGGKFPTERVEEIISGDQPGTAAHGSREMPVWGPVFGQIAWDRDFGKVRIHNLAKYLESIQQ